MTGQAKRFKDHIQQCYEDDLKRQPDYTRSVIGEDGCIGRVETFQSEGSRGEGAQPVFIRHSAGRRDECF